MDSESVAKEINSRISVEGLGFLKMCGLSGNTSLISFAPRREPMPWMTLPSLAL